MRRQPALFADLINGELPNINENPPEPENQEASDNPEVPHDPEQPGSNQNSPDWCKCGLCVPMPTQAENKCCTPSVRPCITTIPLFYQIVLGGNILDVAMRYREDMLAMEHPRNNDILDIQPTGSLYFGNTEDLEKVTGELSQVAV